jgi:enoyl-CoA hydratase/carnithine racemase
MRQRSIATTRLVRTTDGGIVDQTVTLSIDREQHVARITLRTHGDTIGVNEAHAICVYLDSVESDDDVKVVVIDSSGENLCAGWAAEDAWEMYRQAPGGSTKKWPGQRARLIALDELWWGPKGLYSRLLHCKKVTIATAKGRCFDAGLYLVLCCDLTIGDTSAVFSNPRWTSVGVDQDMSLLIASVGLKRAKELMFAGATWSATRAHRIGLIDQVAEPNDLVNEIEKLSLMCASIMRDGIVTEKYAVFASLEKMGIGHSFATAIVVGASMSNLHFQPGEFNFLREMRDHGVDGATEAFDERFSAEP